MQFTKMQGLGNDYVYLNCLEGEPEDLPGLAAALSRPHFGVGADGLICICPSRRADAAMRIFNADGSEGEMCGNGIRCVGKYLYDKGLTHKTTLTIDTLAGVKTLTLAVSEGRVVSVTVDMGEPRVPGPVTLRVDGRDVTVWPVDMGNPHAVIFVPDAQRVELERLGPALEGHPYFPNRTNTEFVQVVDRKRLVLRVWERGSGATLACGTGACAALAAGVRAGQVDREIRAELPGGVLQLAWAGKDNHIYMTGPAETVFEGTWEGGCDRRSNDNDPDQ